MNKFKLFSLLIGFNIFSTMVSGEIIKSDTLDEFSKGETRNLVISNGDRGKVIMDSSLEGLNSAPLSYGLLPLPLAKCAAIELGGRIYIVGGVSSGNSLSSKTYSCKINNLGVDFNNWRSETVLPQGLENPSVLYINGRMVVVPSTNGEKIYSASININDGSIGVWESIGNLPPGVKENSATLVGRRILLITSDGSGRTFSSGFPFNGEIRWRPEGNTPIYLNAFKLVSDNERAYLVGGINNLGAVSVGVYSIGFNSDGSLSSWTSESPLPVGVAFHSASVSRDLLVVAGGTTGSGLNNYIHSTKIGSSGRLVQWETQLANLPNPVKSHNSIITSNGHLLVLGGDVSGSYSDALISFSLKRSSIFSEPRVVGSIEREPFHYGMFTDFNRRIYYLFMNPGGSGFNSQPVLYSIGITDTGTLTGSPLIERGPVIENPREYNQGKLFVMGGRLYLVAGYYKDIPRIYSAELHDDGTLGEWRFVSNGPDRIMYFGTEFVGNRLFIVGGYHWETRTPRSSVFSMQFDSNGNNGPWFPEVSLPQGMSNSGLALCKNNLFICGGKTPSEHNSSVIYSATFTSGGRILRWNLQGDIPLKLNMPSIIGVGNRLILAGGETGVVVNKNIYASTLNESGSLTPWTTVFENINSIRIVSLFSFNGFLYCYDAPFLRQLAMPLICRSGAILYSKVIDLLSVRNLLNLSWGRLVNPSNTSLNVSITSSIGQNETLDSFTDLVNGLGLNKLARYIQLRFQFKSDDGIATPGLDDFTITHFSDSTHPDGAPVLNVVNVTTSSLTVSLEDRSVGDEAFQFFLSRTSPPAGDPIQYTSVLGSSGTTTTYTFDRLLHGTTYYLRARGWNAADSIDGADSNLISIQTPSLDLRRRLSTELLGLDSVVIGWPRVDNAIEYRVFDEANTLLATKSSSTLSYTESGIPPNNRIFRRIEASDSIGVIQVGSVVLFTGLAAPTATDFAIESQGENWITINVNPPLNAPLGLSGTKIILRADGMIVRTARLKNTESAYRFESLPVGKKYQITTSYLNGDGIESLESPVLETFVGLASEIFAPAKEKFQISDGIDFPMDSNEPVQGTLKIYDSQQRILREIPIDSPAGHSVVRWDGRDDNGNPVFSGIYWAVSETDHFGRKTFKVAGIR